MAKATVVLVHGGWGGPGDWDEIVEMLTSHGIPCVAVDLPSCREGVYGDLHADAEAVRDAVDACDGPAVVCGYSYGGFPVTEGAAAHPNVVRLVYLAALMPDESETVLDLLTRASELRDTPPPPPPLLYEDGTSGPAPELSTHLERALAHHPRQVIDRIVNMPRRHQATSSAVQRPSAEAWRSIPSTFVLTTQDQSLPVALQREMASRASEVVEIDFDHFVPFSHPQIVVEILARTASAQPASRA